MRVSRPAIVHRLPAIVLALIVPGAAIAQKPTLGGVGVKPPAPRASVSPIPVTSTSPTTATATPSAGDAGAARFKENAAQQKRRLDYIERTTSLIRGTVRGGNHQITTEEREAIKRHWRRAMRLFRIRDIAEDLGDGANVTRVDADIQNLDTKFYALLKIDSQHAPQKVAVDGGAK